MSLFRENRASFCGFPNQNGNFRALWGEEGQLTSQNPSEMGRIQKSAPFTREERLFPLGSYLFVLLPASFARRTDA